MFEVVQNLTVRAQLLILMTMLTLPAAADEVRRLRLPSDCNTKTLEILRRLLPAHNYTFGRDGACYVAGESDELDAIQFPVDFPANWEPVELETEQFPLSGGCHLEPDAQAIESVPVAKIIGYLQELFPEVVFVPGVEGRWLVVGDADSVTAACQTVQHLPERPPPPQSTRECLVTETEFMFPIYDNAFSQGVFQGAATIVGAQTFPEQAPQNLAYRLHFRY